MTQVSAAVFQGSRRSPQPARGAVSRTGRAAAAKPKAKTANRVTGIETQLAIRGDGKYRAGQVRWEAG